MTYRSNIPALRKAIGPALDTSVGETAGVVKTERDARTPVDTGDLLASGRVVRHAEAHYEVREGDGLPDARARFTEYGTSRMEAQPHMTPAAAVGRRDIGPRAKAAVKKAIRGVRL
jgi:hypothetical protein